MKNFNELNDSWEQIKGKLKERFSILTDNDFLLLEEKKEALISRLQEKLGKTKEEIMKILSNI